MVAYQDAQHPMLIRLLNLRLLHRMRTTWSHADRPGEPYHIFAIDYVATLTSRARVPSRARISFSLWSRRRSKTFLP